MDLLESLKDGGHTSIFPRLESLSLLISEADFSPRNYDIFPVLFSPTITTLRLYFWMSPETGMDVESHVCALVYMLQMAQSLSLEGLGVEANYEELSSSPRVTAALVALIDQQPKLTHLRVCDLIDRFDGPFREAGRLQNLQMLELGMTEWFPYTNEAIPSDPILRPVLGFPSLQTLGVQAGIDDIPNILQSIESRLLLTLSVVIDPPTAETNLGTSLVDVGRFSSLSDISIKFPHIRGTWESFKPLLALPLLEEVELTGDDLARTIGDPQIRDMAQAWPLLRSLIVVDCHLRRTRTRRRLGMGGEYPPAATLLGLSTFATNCPGLKELVIAIDARAVPKDIALLAVGQKVESLRFPDSWADERVLEVAKFIAKVWPNHRYPALGICNCDGRVDVGRDERWEAIWRKASELIGRRFIFKGRNRLRARTLGAWGACGLVLLLLALRLFYFLLPAQGRLIVPSY